MDLRKNKKFKKIVSEVDTDWSIEERVRYVLRMLGICDETIINIVTKGVRIENLNSFSLWEASGFKENFHQKCKELFDIINAFFDDIDKNWTVEERMRYELQKLEICDENIIRIIIAGLKVADLYEHTLLEKSEFPQDFHKGFNELSSSIKDFIAKQEPGKIGIITFISTLQEIIMKDGEIERVPYLFH